MELIPTFVGVTEEKLVRGLFAPILNRVNHLIIFDDSTSAAFGPSAEVSLCFLVSASPKQKTKKPRQLNSWEFLKDTSPRTKYILFEKEKQCFA